MSNCHGEPVTTMCSCLDWGVCSPVIGRECVIKALLPQGNIWRRGCSQSGTWTQDHLQTELTGLLTHSHSIDRQLVYYRHELFLDNGYLYLSPIYSFHSSVTVHNDLAFVKCWQVTQRTTQPTFDDLIYNRIILGTASHIKYLNSKCIVILHKFCFLEQKTKKNIQTWPILTKI